MEASKEAYAAALTRAADDVYLILKAEEERRFSGSRPMLHTGENVRLRDALQTLRDAANRLINGDDLGV